jgi:hypothetical protein
MACRPAGDGQPPHRAQTWQRLTAKAKGMDIEQIRAVNFRGRMARQRQWQIAGGHAAAIIGHPDQGLAAICDLDGYPLCTGINGVFNQFLDRRGRAFHHLASGDPVDCTVIKLTNGRAIMIADMGALAAHTAKFSSFPRFYHRFWWKNRTRGEQK